jgi:hypothetical protein
MWRRAAIWLLQRLLHLPSARTSLAKSALPWQPAD